ncbi:hypothetical protein HY029_02620 [Candidatus Gottesmanbacteria bacterium]|nr:hypothetical protein [Candidatus Gottesmanbacteria bacterium]
MLNPEEIKKRILAADSLFRKESTSKDKFESIRTLLKGINPRIDKTLESCSKILNKFSKLEKGKIIELGSEALPERTEEEKKRKKLLLVFLHSWKQLRSEVNRVKNELDNFGKQKTTTEQVTSIGRIITLAKGPFGIVTLAAIIIVGGTVFLTRNKTQNTTTNISVSPTKEKIKVLVFVDKKIPLTEVQVRTGPDCTVNNAAISHYHALNHIAAKDVNGNTISDPGGCGFGKASETVIEDY